MLKVLICLGGIFIILAIAELLWRRKILRGEYLRKFVHISSAIYVAAWPWLIDWRTIQLIGLAMLAFIWLNHRLKTIHPGGEVRRKTYGFYFFGLSMVVCAALTTNKEFFALAMLHLGLADGLAAVAGTFFHKKLQYDIFGYRKSVYGSMTFWLVSLCILAIGGLFIHDAITFRDYFLMLALLPPVLTTIENLSVKGLDNLTVPVAVVLTLNFLS